MNDTLKNVMIIKAIAGFYYVEAGDSLLQCRARGIFRKNKISPLVGDRVKVSVSGDSGWVEEIHPRKNSLVRPPVANLDKLFLVASVGSPSPDLRLIDKLTVICEQKEIEPIIIFSKNDLGDTSGLINIYKNSGFKTISSSIETGEGLQDIIEEIKGCISAFCGNSGVGKTSILSAVCSELTLETGEVSQKLGRGRHTTRESRIFSIHGGYIADTPGFSSLDLARYERIKKEDLASCFREFQRYIHDCKFTSCAHINEIGCAVKEALQNGEIMQSRYDSYLSLYSEVKDLKEWEYK